MRGPYLVVVEIEGRVSIAYFHLTRRSAEIRQYRIPVSERVACEIYDLSELIRVFRKARGEAERVQVEDLERMYSL